MKKVSVEGVSLYPFTTMTSLEQGRPRGLSSPAISWQWYQGDKKRAKSQGKEQVCSGLRWGSLAALIPGV